MKQLAIKSLVWRISTIALTVLVGTTPASLHADGRAETIKIVSSLPKTGSANAQVTSISNGVRLAIEEAGGKVAGFTISYEDWDDASPQRGAWDPAIEATNAEKAIQDPDVMAYIGPFNSGAAKISMPKLNVARLAIVNGFSSWPGLTKPGVGEANEPMVYRPSGKINFFRVVPADDIQGVVAANWAKQLNATKVFVLHDRELYGQGIATIFKKSAEKIGLEVVGFEGIDPKASNYRSLVTKIRSKSAGLVFFGGTTQTNGGQIAKDIRNGGVNAKFMVPDGCFENAFIEAAGKDALEGRAFITFGGVPPEKLTGAGAKFVEAYKARFGKEPESYATYGYEAGKVVLKGIEKAGKKDREAITSAISEIKDFDGLMGTWSFDSNGDTTSRKMSGSTVEGGKFKFVQILE